MTRIGSLLLLSLLLAATTATAQDRFEALQYGLVVDEQGQSVADVEVRGLWIPAYGSPLGPSLVVARTDREGKFVIPLPAGEVRAIELLAIGPDGQAGYLELDAFRTPEEVAKLNRLVLKPYRKYSVRVLASNGKPLSGVNVSSMPDFLGDFTRQTDQNGEAIVPIPQANDATPIVAWDRRMGIDYVHVCGVYGKQKYRVPYDFTGVIELKLQSWKRRQVRVAGLDNQPLGGVSLTPKGFWLEEKREPFLDCATWIAYTNDDGLAEIVFPGASKLINFDVALNGYRQIAIDPLRSEFKRDIFLPRMVSLTGTVTYADGTPAEHSNVYVKGGGPRVEYFSRSTIADERGHFHMEVPSDIYCIVVARNKELETSTERRIVREGESIEPLKLTLGPLTVVSGVAVDREGKPIASEYVRINSSDDEAKYFDKLPQGEKLSAPPGSQNRFQYSFLSDTKTDKDGNFQLLLPPGEYETHVGIRGTKQTFTVVQEMPLELTLVDETIPKRMLKVRVVKADEPNQGVEKAKVAFVSVPSGATKQTRFEHHIGNTCNAEGECEFEVKDTAYVVSAFLPRKDLYAFAFIPAGTKELTLELAPRVSIEGTLLHADGSPVFRGSLTADIEFEGAPDLYSPLGHQGDYTDEEGKFVIKDLYPGQKYNIRVFRGLTPDKKGVLIDDLFSYTPKPGDNKKDIGTFKLKPLEDD